MDKNKTIWVAGLLEGEGYFGLIGNRLVVKCVMTDKDVIEKLQTFTGIGNIFKRKKRDTQTMDPYEWGGGTRSEITSLLKKILPYMGTRRSKKIKLMLDHDKKFPKKRTDDGAVKHGMRSMYGNKGCRCDLCREAERNYKRPKRKIKC